MSVAAIVSLIMFSLWLEATVVFGKPLSYLWGQTKKSEGGEKWEGFCQVAQQLTGNTWAVVGPPRWPTLGLCDGTFRSPPPHVKPEVETGG